MRTAFIIIALLGLLYFTLKKRRFDFIALAYFSSCFYFLPGFSGYVLDWTLERKIESSIVPQVYWVMIIVLLVLIITAFLNDSYPIRRTYTLSFGGFEKHASKIFLQIMFLIAIAGFAITVLKLGSTLLESKRTIIEAKGRYYNFWIYPASIAAIMAYYERKMFILLCSFALLILDVFLMNERTSIVMVIISIFVLALYNKGRIRLIKYWKLGIIFSIIGLFFFMFALIRNPLKEKDWQGVKSILNREGVIMHSITHSEPYTTQAILNKFFTTNYKADPKQITSSFYSIIPFGTEFGIEFEDFHVWEKDLFYEELEHGRMAANIWAQLWSIGRWPLLISGALVYGILTLLGSRILTVQNSTSKVISVLFMSFISFYIHRNHVLSMIAIERRIIFLTLFTLFLSIIIYLNALKKNHEEDYHV